MGILDPRIIENLFTVFMAVMCGLTLRITMTLIGQKWINTFHHTLSYILLPVITLVITKVIAGNLALSLGMIGALSIVRFRNPVKNPFELVMFFALITIGIAMAVKIHWGLLLTAVIIIILILSKLIEKIGNYYGFNTFSLSFEEGSTIHIMEVKSISSIKILDENKNLSQSFSTKNPISYNYRLIFSDKNEIND